MFLSRLTLPLADPEAQRLLADPYALHKALMGALPDRAGRMLYRVEPVPATGTRATVLVQSLDEPDWSDAGLPQGTAVECKAFDAEFRTGDRLRFRLKANPTAKKRVEGRDDTTRVGIVKEDEQRAWLARKGERGGFEPDGVVVIDEGQVKARRSNGRTMTFRSVRFEGALEVTDPGRLAETLRAGVGSGKAFGFGLLSLART